MRKRIWELNDYQCSIIGACLSPAELVKLSRRFGQSPPSKATDYSVHSTHVALCTYDCPVARAVEKALNRKYATTLRRFAKAKDDDALAELWRRAVQDGDIPGPYWALLSHPLVSVKLRAQAFGEVHMLSHITGAESRRDLQQHAALAKELERTGELLAKLRAHSGAKIRSLRRDNKDKQQLIRELAKEVELLRQRSKPLAPAALNAENSALQRSLGMQMLRLVEMKSENRALGQRLRALEQRLETLQEERNARAEEVAFLEIELARLAARDDAACPQGCPDAGTDRCPSPLLCGKRILYVGGRVNLVRHYRELVERLGGEFRHHDGGVEESPQLLHKLLSGMDAVLCPRDCISHEACRCVKEACRKGVTQLLMLRSSGLSSLARCLEDMTRQSSSPRSLS